MKKVGIPYEMREDKLYMPPVAWPLSCPCCGRDAAGGQHRLEHKARYASTSTGSTTTSSYYPLEWQVPYCQACNAHAERVSNLRVIIIILALLVPIGLTIALGAASDTLAFLLILAGTIVVGLIAYQVLLRVLVFPKMTGTCSHYDAAVFASDDTQQVFFHFYRDDQAGRFAQMNQAELMDDVKPNFWRLKKN